MAGDARISELLLHWEEQREQGHTLSAAELCAECPELIEELQQQMRTLGGPDSRRDSTRENTDVLANNSSGPAPSPPIDVQADTLQPSSPDEEGFFPDKETLAPTEPIPEPPRKTRGRPLIPGYEILAELGRGGMGVVYKARQIKLNRLVALKMILRGRHAGADDLARFQREAEAVACLQHPHIVQIYEVGEHNGCPYIALEFVDGASLYQQFDGAPQPARKVAQQVELLARAIHVAHQAGIIHRDLKPANILLSRDGTPKITDFGLAKRLDDDARQTSTGIIMGTPCYMAPEQAAGKKQDIGPPVDIYALGAIVYELLSGRPPFLGTTVQETLDQVRFQEPVPPSRLQLKLPRDLETICLKCLEKEPKNRYASALDLADDLRRFQAGEPIRARPVNWWKRVLKWARRRPAAAAVVVISLTALLGLVVLGLFWYHAELQAARNSALLAKRQLKERDRLEDVRVKARKWLDAAEMALATNRWSRAKKNLERVLAAVGSEQALVPLWARADTLLDQAETLESARKKYAQFQERREEALFYSTQVTGLDSAANREALRLKVQAALKLFEITTQSGGQPVLNEGHFSKREQEEISADCYTLLLLLAEEVARPLPSEDPRRQARQALVLLDRAAELVPPTRAHHLRRARYLDRLGQGSEADLERRRADRAALQGSANVVDAFLEGYDSYRENDFPRALASFDQALRLKPNYFWAQFLSAVCYLRSERPGEAKVSLTACLSRKADLVWPYLLRGFAYGELGSAAQRQRKVPEAKRHFKNAEQDFARASECKRSAEADYVLCVNRGVLRLRQNKLARAAADFQQAIKLKPKQFHAYLNLAQVHERQHKLQEALVPLDRAIQLEGKQAILYRTRARLQLRLQHPEAALQDLERAIALTPARGAARDLAHDQVERGRIQHRAQHYAEAVRAYQAALKARPDHPAALRLCAEALIELHRDREAVRYLDRYLAQAVLTLGDYRRTREPVAEVYRERGLARARLGNYAATLDDYARALEVQPDSAGYTLRGWAYLVNQSPSLALKDFEEAIRLDPKNGDAHNGRGFARVSLNLYRAAVRDAEVAMRLGPRDARTRYNAARIFAQAVGKIEVDPTQRTQRGLKTRSFYEARALELIHAALDLCATAEQRTQFWRTSVLVDRALEPIRRSPGFRQLAARYARPAKSSSPQQ